MLVLSRRQGESIVLADNIIVTIMEIRGDLVRIGVDAPPGMTVHRQEVYQAIQRRESASSEPSGPHAAFD